MSNIYNHRQLIPPGPATTRFSEILDNLKNEFEQLQQEAIAYKMQRDDYEHKVQQQMEEVNLIRQGLYDLQATQQKIKQQYDNEIMRLNRDLEQQRLHHPSTSGGHSQASHPPQPPPTIGQGGSNLFSGIMSGTAGQQGLVAPPQMPLDPSQQQQQQPTSHPGYPGPSGPPQNVSQGSSSSAPSPYLNGSVITPGALSQPQHSSNKRQRLEDGVPQGGPLNMPLSQPPQQGPLYPNNGLPQAPQNQPGQPLGGQSYMQNVGQTKPGSKMPKIPQNLGPDGPQQSNIPQNGGPQQPLPSNKRKTNPSMNAPAVQGSRPPPIKQGSVSNATGLGDMDPETVAPAYKKEGTDWFAIFNPKVPRLLDVDLVHTLDHSSVVCCVKFSADGRYLATGCNRSAQIYDVQTGGKLSILADENVDKSGDLYIRSVCFSPDGKYLATGAEDKQIRIWDIQSQKIRNMFQGHDQDIYSLDFSRDGRYIVSGSGDKTARVWDMVSGEMLFKLSIDEASQKDAGVTSVAISPPDGQYVAAGSLDKIVRVWDARSGYLLERLEGHKDSVYSVAFSPDGKTLVSGSLDKTLRLWDMSHPGRSGNSSNPKSHKMTFSGHKDFVLSVAVSPDGRWIVSGSKDRGVQFWDPNNAQTQFMLQGHKNSVISVALSPVGKLFATGSGDCRARVWRYEQGHD